MRSSYFGKLLQTPVLGLEHVVDAVVTEGHHHLATRLLQSGCFVNRRETRNAVNVMSALSVGVRADLATFRRRKKFLKIATVQIKKKEKHGGGGEGDLCRKGVPVCWQEGFGKMPIRLPSNLVLSAESKALPDSPTCPHQCRLEKNILKNSNVQ